MAFCPKRLASEWSSLPAHWTQPRNSYEYEGLPLNGVEMVAVRLLRTELEEIGFAWSLRDPGETQFTQRVP